MTATVTHLWSYSEVSRRLGIHRRTVADLVTTLGLTPKPMPSNGRAKGLSAQDIARIWRALNPSKSEATAGRPRPRKTRASA